jgi:hypothetical protein
MAQTTSEVSYPRLGGAAIDHSKGLRQDGFGPFDVVTVTDPVFSPSEDGPDLGKRYLGDFPAESLALTRRNF